MEHIYQINPLNTQKEFTEEEAYRLVEILVPITSKAKNSINALQSKMEVFQYQPELTNKIQEDINTLIHKWSEKVKRLGGSPLALYRVRIPSENNSYFVWEHPSIELELFH